MTIAGGVQNTTIRMYYKKGEIGKGWIKHALRSLTAAKVDNYEIFSVPVKKRQTGEKPWFVTKTNKNAGFTTRTVKSVKKKGTRYFIIKCNGVREIAGET